MRKEIRVYHIYLHNFFRKIIKINPTKSCLYPMRDWVTCVESCVNYFPYNSLGATSYFPSFEKINEYKNLTLPNK